MTYRERREARAEKRRAWAESRAAKAESAYQGAHTIADGIPLGQPILVGHHSERRARRDQDRIHSGFRRAAEHDAMASHHSAAADTIERQLDASIYDDDPDAIDRLRAKLAGLEARRDRIKAYNAACRKAKRATPEALELLDEAQRRDLDTIARVAAYQLRAYGQMPAYASSNLSGTIKTTRDRLERLEADQEERIEETFGPLEDGKRTDPLDRPRKPMCRSCGHHFDHHRASRVYCTGDDARCRCEHYWYDERALQPGDIDPDNGRTVERVTGTADAPVIVYRVDPLDRAPHPFHVTVSAGVTGIDRDRLPAVLHDARCTVCHPEPIEETNR